MAFDDVLPGALAPGIPVPPEPSSKNPLKRLAEETDYVDRLEKIRAKALATIYVIENGQLYKHVRVNMRGVDGNAFNILGVVITALSRARAPMYHQQVFKSWATAGDYDHLLRVCSKWVTIVDEAEDRGSAVEAFQQRAKRKKRRTEDEED